MLYHQVLYIVEKLRHMDFVHALVTVCKLEQMSIIFQLTRNGVPLRDIEVKRYKQQRLSSKFYTLLNFVCFLFIIYEVTQ